MEEFFSRIISDFVSKYSDKNVQAARVGNALKNSLDIDVLTNTLAEVLRVSKRQAEEDLAAFGAKELVEQYRLKQLDSAGAEADDAFMVCGSEHVFNPFQDLFKVRSTPEFTGYIPMDKARKQAFIDMFITVEKTFETDPFPDLYRNNVPDYFNSFMKDVAPVIDRFIAESFNNGYPRYIVVVGIGANEQFTHYIAGLNNSKPERSVMIVVNSSKAMLKLPADLTVENTLFMEFSRSGLTEETVKVHEYTPTNAKRIVFANKGPLYELAKRDNNMLLELPDEVSGRFGRNKTPILLAPMYAAGMDVRAYWDDIAAAVKAFDVTNTDALPNLIARFLYINQQLSGRNFIYLGCNDDALGLLCDEFIQYWNEGVNKDKNDFLMSRFFGLPRDSHMNIEGVLANRDTKTGIFVLRTDLSEEQPHAIVNRGINPAIPAHAGLSYTDEEVIFSYANYKRFAEVMPAILIEVPGKPSLRHSAVLGQLFADTTYVYSRYMGIDPGSNPEVKFVRERSSKLLAELAEIKRANPGITIGQALELLK